jgi:hypothetical protein
LMEALLSGLFRTLSLEFAFENFLEIGLCSHVNLFGSGAETLESSFF